MGLFHIAGRLVQLLDSELVGTEWWPDMLCPRHPSLSFRRSPRLSHFPAYQTPYQLRATIRRSPGRALRSIQRASLDGRRSQAASAARRWMLPTVERGPPVHFSV